MQLPTRIIDAHHHLWHLQMCHYPWLMAKGVKRFFGDPAPIQKNYLPEDFREDIGDLPVEASVHIQVGVQEDQAVDETRWLQSVADSADSRAIPGAIVAFCDLSREDAMKVISRHQHFPNLRGIRQIVGRSPEENRRTGSDLLLNNPLWRENLSRLVERDLSFDLQLIPEQMQEAIGVFNEMPGLKVALCHCGSPFEQSDRKLAEWASHLRDLAELPDVYCKLSGFGMFDHDWTCDSIRPLVHTVIDVFTPARCMFASNFPVDRLYSDYHRLWRTYSYITSDFSEEERDQMFYANARDFYRIAVP